MNWLILIIAGLCETGFAFCLGKTKLAVSTEYWLWISGFAVLYVLSAVRRLLFEIFKTFQKVQFRVIKTFQKVQFIIPKSF